MCRTNLCILPIVVAAILSIVVGALFFVGIIAAEFVAIPVAIGLIFASITLILLFVTAAFGTKKEIKECICDYGKCLSIGAFITMMAGIIALTFIGTLAIGSIVSALLIGVFAFGIILNFLSFIGLVMCLLRTSCYRRECYNLSNNCNE